MANVPNELVNEILLWLPVKSLLRFRCVCKHVCASIGSQSFINSHFKNTSENRIHRKLIDLGFHKVDNDCLKIQALDFNDDFQQELVLEKPASYRLYPYIFSYCNGLVLLCILPRKLSVWNPSTRKYRILPAFPVKYARNVSFALGYDSTADDYKAVLIISKKGWDRSQVWIFELRSSSCWRRIQDFPFTHYNNIENGGNGDCFVDGSMHFICHDRDEYALYIIVAFDVAKETFSIVYEPIFIFLPEDIPTSLHVFGGCISVSFWKFVVEERVDIFVMKEEEIAVTMTKLYSVKEHKFQRKHFECFAEGRVAYSKEGDKVFLSSNGMLCSYNLKEKTLQEIVTKNTYPLHIFSCTESLASVGS